MIIIKFAVWTALACSFLLCDLSDAKADVTAPVSVEVWALHRGGFVTYQYKVTNRSTEAIDSMTIGFNPVDASDSQGAEITQPPLSNFKSFWLSPDKTTSPRGWGAAVHYPDESSKLMIDWIEGNKEHEMHPSEVGVQGMPSKVSPPNVLLAGTTWDTFKVEIQKDDLAYVTGHATFILGGKLVSVPIKKGDITPPTVSVSLLQVAHSHPTNSTLKFSVSAVDNYDLVPTTALESVKSNQQLTPGDVQAQVGSDTRTVTVKNVPGRTYHITFSATDASGNVGRKTVNYMSP